MGSAREEKNGVGETGKLATPHPEYPTYDGCEDRTRDAFWAYLEHTLSHEIRDGVKEGAKANVE